MTTKQQTPTTQQSLPAASDKTADNNGGNADNKIEKKADKIDARLPAGNAGQLSKFLNQNSQLLNDFARGFMKPEAMIRLSLIAFTKSPILSKCTMASILRSLMDAAALRVRPGGLNGRGYLVPRKNNKTNPACWECHFDPGWRGLVDVARRSGQVKALGAQVVRDGDYFEYGYDPLPYIKWKPLRQIGTGAADKEGVIPERPIVAAFAVAQLSDEAIQIEVLEGEDLRKIKMTSESFKAGSGPWIDWESEQCRKSAVKRLCKYLPVPDDFDELDKAMALSDGADIGERILDVPGEEVPADAPPTQSETIRGQLKEKVGKSAAEQLDELDSQAAELAIGAQ